MKYLILTFLSAIFFTLSCKREVGCQYQEAINYNKNADKACDDCCEFLNDTVFISTSDTVFISNGINPEDLNGFRQNIVGNWEGIASSPWQAPYAVQIQFNADGSYSATCTDNSAVAFYYGTDDDNSLKVYELNSTTNYNNQLVAEGTIDIYFSGAGTINHDELTNIRFSDQNDSLFFDFVHNGIYGPIVYELNRM